MGGHFAFGGLRDGLGGMILVDDDLGVLRYVYLSPFGGPLETYYSWVSSCRPILFCEIRGGLEVVGRQSRFSLPPFLFIMC